MNTFAAADDDDDDAIMIIIYSLKGLFTFP